ncbi:MAG: hypothetical protein HY423_03090 [Candidatus Lambdaproteobacteria bacterium]|nr:hypothetical protein [Candidatus Lambdaproteobacteria bacterium]
MSETRKGRGRDRKRGGGGRHRESQFMDAALDAFVRQVALDKWRQYEGLVAGGARTPAAALAELGEFPERGLYDGLWRAHWRQHVLPPDPPGAPHPFGRMEAAVRAALREESDQRRARNDLPIEDTPDYKAFVAAALEQLFEEAAGEIEHME